MARVTPREGRALWIAALVLVANPTRARAQAESADPMGICALVRDQAARYPESETADLYKLAHQAAFGPAHAAPDLARARSWLMAEIGAIRSEAEPGSGRTHSETRLPAPPLFEPLLPDSSIGRVNLRPFLAAGGDPEVLLSAFLRAVEVHAERSETFDRYWSCFVALARERAIAVTEEDLAAYRRAREAEGLPAVHHSDAYVDAYRPAYRLVRGARLTEPDAGPGAFRSGGQR